MNTLLRYTILIFAAGYPAALLLQSSGVAMPDAETVLSAYAAISLLLIALSDYSRRAAHPRVFSAKVQPHTWRPSLPAQARAAKSLVAVSRCAP